MGTPRPPQGRWAAWDQVDRSDPEKPRYFAWLLNPRGTAFACFYNQDLATKVAELLNKSENLDANPICLPADLAPAPEGEAAES